MSLYNKYPHATPCSVSYVKVEQNGMHIRYITNDMEIAQRAYKGRGALVHYDNSSGEYTVEFEDVLPMPHVPPMPSALQEVEKTLPEGYIFEYQLEDGMWHVVDEAARGAVFAQRVQERLITSWDEQYCMRKDGQSILDYGKWEQDMSKKDTDAHGEWPHLSKKDVLKLAQETSQRYGGYRGSDVHPLSIDETGEVDMETIEEQWTPLYFPFRGDNSVASPEGQQMPFPLQTPNWPSLLPEASEESVRASQGHCGNGMRVNAQIDGNTLVHSLNYGFVDALRKLESEAGESAQYLEKGSKGIAKLAEEDGEVAPMYALLDAINEMDNDPDDSCNRMEFYKALAVYMLDNNFDMRVLEAVMLNECSNIEPDEEEDDEEEDLEQETQKPVVKDDYYDKVWE